MVVLIGSKFVLVQFWFECTVLQILHHFLFFLFYYFLQFCFLPNIVPLQKIRTSGNTVAATFSKNRLERAFTINLMLLLLMTFHNFLLKSATFIVQVLPDWLMHFSSQLRMFSSIVIVNLFHLIFRIASRTVLSIRRVVIGPFSIQIISTRRVPEIGPCLRRLVRILFKRVMVLPHLVDSLSVGLEENMAILHSWMQKMLIIQFITMSDSKLKQVVKKYEKRYKFNKSDFIEFVTSKVEFSSQKKCKQFINTIQQDINQQFTVDQLQKLLHYIAAFQAGHNIREIDDDDHTGFVKIKFKGGKEKSKGSEPIQKNQKSIIGQEVVKNKNVDKMIKKQPELSTTDKFSESINNNFRTQPKQQHKKTEIKLNIEELDDDDGGIYMQRKDDTDQERIRQQKQSRERQIRKEQQRIQRKQRERLEKQKERERQTQKERDRQMQMQRNEEARLRQQKQMEIKRRKKQQQELEQLQQCAALKRKSQAEKQTPNKKASNFVRNDKQKQRKQLKTIEEQKTDEISMSSSSNVVGNENRKGSVSKIEVIQDVNTKELVNISKFEKVGQDYINPVIKYQIVYKDQFITWRRYSQIEKLVTFLRCRYEGIVLPEMPPKEGIKSNLSYFWKNQVNQQFLDQRKQKLKQLLNRLLACQYVCQDETLQKFLEEPQYELPNINESQTYMQTIFGLKDIVFNYNELKDYGVAYYNYISQYKKKTINTECSQQYDKLQTIMASIIAVNEYRVVMNSNFERRRQIMYDSKMKPKGPCKTEFDRVLEEAQVECHQLNMEYSRYLQLKSTEGWQKELIKQKSSQGGEALEKIKENHTKTLERISKTQKNLIVSIRKFLDKSEGLLKNMAKQIIEWRRKAHP